MSAGELLLVFCVWLASFVAVYWIAGQALYFVAGFLWTHRVDDESGSEGTEGESIHVILTLEDNGRAEEPDFDDGTDSREDIR